MHLIQILLPQRFPGGHKVPGEVFEMVMKALTDQFGGVTAFIHSPAEGLWKDRGAVEEDSLFVFEVHVSSFNREWWRSFKDELLRSFQQKELIVRVLPMRLL